MVFLRVDIPNVGAKEPFRRIRRPVLGFQIFRSAPERAFGRQNGILRCVLRFFWTVAN